MTIQALYEERRKKMILDLPAPMRNQDKISKPGEPMTSSTMFVTNIDASEMGAENLSKVGNKPVPDWSANLEHNFFGRKDMENPLAFDFLTYHELRSNIAKIERQNPIILPVASLKGHPI